MDKERRAFRLAVRRNASLSPRARLLFEDVCELSERSGDCRASDGHFAKAYGANRRTVRRWIAELKAAGAIVVTGSTRARRIAPNYPATEPATEPRAEPLAVPEPEPKAPGKPASDLGHIRVLKGGDLGHSGASVLGHSGVHTKSIPIPERQQQHAPAREPDESRAIDALAAAAFSELTSRGVDPSVAARLADQYPERVAPLCRRFDLEVESGRVAAPGWLVRAVEEGYAAGTGAVLQLGRLLTYSEMLKRYDELGGGNPTGPASSHYFEQVNTDVGPRYKERARA